MKKPKTLREMWEHPFSGKDYHDDNRFPEYHGATPTGGVTPATNNIQVKSTELAAHYHQKQLHPDHRSQLELYTWGSSAVNHSLIDPNKATDSTRQAVSRLDGAMESVGPSTPHDMHVYSGIRFDPQSKIVSENGQHHLHLPAFTSTSLDPITAKVFSGGDIVKIHVPKGSHGYYAPGITGKPDSEHEFIIPRGAKLRVHPEPTEDAQGGKYKIWHAKLVHDGIQSTRHADEDT